MTKLVTRYGPVEGDSDLGTLDQQAFLNWCKEYKKTHNDYPSSTDAWIVLYKKTLAEDYAKTYYSILNKLGD